MNPPPEERPAEYLRNSRRKNLSRQVRRQYERPLPVKVESDGLTSSYFPWIYEGILIGKAVWLVSKRDKRWVHAQGFFGKGMLSKAGSAYDETVRIGNQQCLAISTTQKQLKRKLKRDQAKAKRKRSTPAPSLQSTTELTPTIGDRSVSPDGFPVSMETASSAAPQLQQLEEPALSPAVEFEEDSSGVESDDDQNLGDDPVLETLQLGQGTDADHIDGLSATKKAQKAKRKRFERTPEHLQLSLEEAFFLQFTLACLQVRQSADGPVYVAWATSFWQQLTLEAQASTQFLEMVTDFFITVLAKSCSACRRMTAKSGEIGGLHRPRFEMDVCDEPAW